MYQICFEKDHKGGLNTISYDRLWITMKQRGISQYKLIRHYHISSGQLDRLRKNENVSTYTLNLLCSILHCKLEDIAEYCSDTPNADPLSDR